MQTERDAKAQCRRVDDEAEESELRVEGIDQDLVEPAVCDPRLPHAVRGKRVSNGDRLVLEDPGPLAEVPPYVYVDDRPQSDRGGDAIQTKEHNSVERSTVRGRYGSRCVHKFPIEIETTSRWHSSSAAKRRSKARRL